MPSNRDPTEAPLPDESVARTPPSRLPPTAVAADEAPWPARYAVITPSAVIGYTDLEYPIPPDRAAGVLRPRRGMAGSVTCSLYTTPRADV